MSTSWAPVLAAAAHAVYLAAVTLLALLGALLAALRTLLASLAAGLVGAVSLTGAALSAAYASVYPAAVWPLRVFVTVSVRLLAPATLAASVVLAPVLFVAGVLAGLRPIPNFLYTFFGSAVFLTAAFSLTATLLSAIMLGTDEDEDEAALIKREEGSYEQEGYADGERRHVPASKRAAVTAAEEDHSSLDDWQWLQNFNRRLQQPGGVGLGAPGLVRKNPQGLLSQTIMEESSSG